MRRIIGLGFVLIIIVSIWLVVKKGCCEKEVTGYIKGDCVKVALYNKDLIVRGTLRRGTKVILLQTKHENGYVGVKYKEQIYYLPEENVTTKLNDIIGERIVYVKTPATIYEDLESGKIGGYAPKGLALTVIGYDQVDKQGVVNYYKVQNKEIKGFVAGKYVSLNEEELEQKGLYEQIHAERGDRFGGGDAGNLDYGPVVKPSFKENVMPKPVRALYLNSGRLVLNQVDQYLELAKQTKINAFVVDIKDDQAPGFKALTFAENSPTNYQYANNTLETYQAVIKKIKDAGFYVIGRMTVFKDKYYALDHPEFAVMDLRTNEPLLHGGTYWPSPFQRKVWEFNVELAKEAVITMGFNEIQFDYVRFPDRIITIEKEGHINLKNEYGEEKAEAIQNFFRYACDELHQLNVYVSADVFGESAYNYVTAYGQYWGAISNIVDVISGMPYPDHFNPYEFDFRAPVWTVPYELLNYWGSNYVMKRQTEIPTPALLRTWIQLADVPNYKHPGGYLYGPEQVRDQIKGLVDAGLTDGYMTWLSSSNLERYQKLIDVFSEEF